MPIPVSMSFELTPAERTTILSALDSVIGVLRAKAEINLTEQERQQVRSVSNQRCPILNKHLFH